MTPLYLFSLHTNLTRKFLELFYKLTEDDTSQIIALYSLNRYKERYDKKIDKEYLLGRYDAIPVFDDEVLEELNV